MKILRTPDSRFKNIKDFPYDPNYTVIKTHDGSDLRIHHIDEGPNDGPTLLVMHGQPVWSYLYSRMIPYLTDAGIRVIAPDLPGYGKSDKPASREDYSYQRQVDWMTDWIKANDFNNLTFFKIKAFRNSDIKLNPISMQREIRKMDGKNISGSDSSHHPALSFMYWQKLCWDTEDLPIGFMMTNMMERNSRIKILIYFIFLRLGLRKLFPFKSNLDKAYEAPFPDPSYKMGPRAMPSHVPMIPDQSLEAQKKARELRYDFFTFLSLKYNYTHIMTAHHLDDNIETILINIYRGKKLNPLTGIKQINNTIVRPLLSFTKDDIVNYAKKNKLTEFDKSYDFEKNFILFLVQYVFTNDSS